MSLRIADAIFWIAVACCVVAQLAILQSVVVSPARAPDREPASATRRIAEIAWAILPGVALAVVFVFTWEAIHAAHVLPPLAAGISR
jgi:heme/copper-type cytochrome/quinol oxidase subunit 2